MSRDKNGAKGRQEIREETQKRLKWLMLEAKEEEIDSREVEALVHLLTVLEEETGGEEAQPDAEAAYRRFLQYKEEREEDEQRLHAAAGGTCAEISRSEPERKKRTGKKRGKAGYVSVAAAAAVLLLVGAGVGVSARKDSGFFHWLKKDETGVTLITSPENLTTETNMDGTLIYTNPADVPEKYRQYVVTEADIQALEGFELQKMEIVEGKNYTKEQNIFTKDGKEECLTIGGLIYSAGTAYDRENYFDYQYLYNIQVGEHSLEVFLENQSTDAQHIICFYYGNVQYFVQGEYELKFLEEVATQYAEFIIM